MLQKIVLFVTCVVLGFLIISQYNAEKQAEKTLSRDSNISYVQQFNLLVSTNEKLREERDALQTQLTQIQSEATANQTIEEEIRSLEKITGNTSVHGTGVTITVEANVDPFWLVDLLNELHLAGAEAISINDIRIDHQTGFVGQSSPTPQIFLNNEILLTTPYMISVIGDPETLSEFLLQEQGILKRLQANYPEYREAVRLEEQQTISMAAK